MICRCFVSDVLYYCCGSWQYSVQWKVETRCSSRFHVRSWYDLYTQTTVTEIEIHHSSRSPTYSISYFPKQSIGLTTPSESHTGKLDDAVAHIEFYILGRSASNWSQALPLVFKLTRHISPSAEARYHPSTRFQFTRLGATTQVRAIAKPTIVMTYWCA